MGLSGIDKSLWLLNFLGQIVLLTVLVYRRRAKQFPVFSAWICFATLREVLNFVVYRFAGQTAYFWTYWSLVLVDSLLQVGVVFEMAREILRPTGTWVRDARTLFILGGLAGALVAAGLSFAVDPKAPTGLFSWSIKLDLFTSLLIAELVVAMSFSAQRLGLQWRSWVMGLGQGLMLWVAVSLFVATAQSYWGWTKGYVALDHLRMGASVAAFAYWCIVFWRNEPERKPISPEMMKYLYSIQADLSYDLGRVHPKRK